MAIQDKVPPQEYPDIVGPAPENPLAAAFRPFIPASVKLPELTILPLIVGTVLGMVFGASSLYLVLKVGLTVSASIPVAVISITFFRLLAKFGRKASILENNIVQTAGSAGESIAFGVGVTMPAIMITAIRATIPPATSLSDRSWSVRSAEAAARPLLPERPRKSASPPWRPCQIVGSERNRLMMPPAATAPAPM